MAESRDKPRKQQKGKPNPKQLQFLKAYLDPKSPTFSNGTQSALSVYSHKSLKSAAAHAHDTIRSPSVQMHMQAMLEELDISDTDCMVELSRVVHGTSEMTTTIKKQGQPDTVITRTPSAGDKIKAIDLINKSTGKYEMLHEAARSMAREREQRMRAALRAVKAREKAG